MNTSYNHARLVASATLSRLLSSPPPDDPVAARLHESARRMIVIAVFSGVVNVLMLSGSLYMLQVYDRVIPSRNVATLIGLSLMVLTAYLMQGYFDALRSRMLCRVATLFDVGLQEHIHTALATLPLRGAKPMLMQQPLRDLDQIRTFMSGMGPTAFLDMPWIPIFLIALFLFHPLIGFTALAGTDRDHRHDAALRTAVAQRGQGSDGSSAQRQVLADTTQRNAEVIRALGMLDRFTARWARANERYLRENIRASDVSANLGSGAKVLRYVLQSGMLGHRRLSRRGRQGLGRRHDRLLDHDGPRAGAGRNRAGQLEAARRRAARHQAAARDLQGDGAARRAAGRAAAAEPRACPCRISPSRAPGMDKPIVTNVSFALSAGMGLALLGASASGKTSLSKALVGIWPAQSGVVRLDGAALDQWRNGDLGRYIGYLPQDVALFDGTVAENICRFDETATSDAILKAARIAGVHDIILRLPEGYATRIGSGGMSLSAGQRQRVGLARAVFGDPFLVVLDEPNANLDAEGEQALTRAIQILRVSQKHRHRDLAPAKRARRP